MDTFRTVEESHGFRIEEETGQGLGRRLTDVASGAHVCACDGLSRDVRGCMADSLKLFEYSLPMTGNPTRAERKEVGPRIAEHLQATERCAELGLRRV